MKNLLIYGAAGYTGRIVSAHAQKAGLNPILAGRDKGKLAKLATELGVQSRVFALTDAAAIDQGLTEVSVVLNCAGPFLLTAEPLMRAALRAGAHYLDIAGELDSYRLAETLDEEAKAAGVMLLPGSGGSVAMLGSLAGHAFRRVPRPCMIRIALQISGPMSRGAAKSATENVATDCLALVDGKLAAQSPDDVRDFDFGKGPVSCIPVTLPDLMTIYHATRIPNVETFVRVAGKASPTGDVAKLPEGPTEKQREAARYQAAVQVTGGDGIVRCSVLDTVNGYTFTALAATEAARRVLAGEVRPGFQTPAGLFGNGFAGTIADTTITDL